MPAHGGTYIVAGTATGAWAGHEDDLASFIDGDWMFFAPNPGWTVWDSEADAPRVYSGAAWQALPGTVSNLANGSWTPALNGSTTAGTPVYTAANGQYSRISNMLFATGRIVWSDLGRLSGYVELTGLPHACAAGIEHRALMQTPWYNGLAMGAGVTMLGGFPEPGTSKIRLWGASNAPDGINLLLNESHLTATGEIYFNCTYMTV